MNSVSLTKLCVLTLLTATVVGCAGGDIGTVTGTIHMDGKPLEGALVTFYPQVADDSAMEKGGASQGRTDASGAYELIYNRDVKGAEVGPHLVYIETGEEGGGGYGGGRAEEVPKRYNSESELKVEVKPGRNTFDFLDLTSEGDKEKVRDLEGGRY